MERMFETHRIRKSCEAAPLWTLSTLDAGGLSAAEKVLVPGVWETLPKLRNYQGRGVYTQQISCGGNVRFWLGGVSFRAKVWLDNALLCEHYGAYTGFEALVMNVPQGVHTLRVEADNRFGEDSALHVPNDYYSYGGINRPVLIEQLGAAYITGMQVTPKQMDGVWHACVTVSVRSLACDRQAELRVMAAGGEIAETLTLKSGEEIQAQIELLCPNAEPWSPDSPVLTAITAMLCMDGTPVDDLIDRFGFREVKVSGNQILLNGSPIRLKGFNRHEDFNDYGVSMPVEAMMRDLLLMRDMGANCVRTCHYPNDPRFLDLCDELGMLVWEESHSRGLEEPQMRNPNFMPQLRLSTQEMVAQHFNHPAIVIWGCLNECADDTEYGEACYRELFALLHQLDSSRPMTAALLERAGGRVFDAPDVVSFNMYPLWYYNAPVADSIHVKKAEIDAKGGVGKPIIISEIGAGAIYGYHDPLGEAKWSEERQCAILREQIKAVLESPDCMGLFLWQYADVRVDESWAPRRPRTFNNKGVVDEYRRPKMAYAVVKELFHRL